MRTAEEWLSEYSESHQNPVNIAIHKIAVPLITFSVLGLLWLIPLPGVPSDMVWLNGGTILLGVSLWFYQRLSTASLLKMVLFTAPMLVGLYYLAQTPYHWQVCLGIFVVAWIFQFIGHKIEGKKPSFFKDVQFLLIGPLWTVHQVFSPAAAVRA